MCYSVDLLAIIVVWLCSIIMMHAMFILVQCYTVSSMSPFMSLLSVNC